MIESKSVLQAWVMALPLRAQGTLLTGIRNCDVSPKPVMRKGERYMSADRQLVAFLRYCCLNPQNPEEVDIPGAWFQSCIPSRWRPSEFGHFPKHWCGHLMHCYEVVAYLHPNEAYRRVAFGVYETLVEDLHLNVETRDQMLRRLTEDRIAKGNVVS